MKFVFIVLAILAALGAYLYLHPDVWQGWVKNTPLAPAPTTTHIYKWQDANGAWQITDTPPATGIKYELLEYRSDTNVMPALPEKDD
ncbi:MAG: hypothetical protein HW411_972 [Gammaproteobacteria bacterium]|nr:hypothetical protein [Gammaproteobacteria bacterium]